MLSNFTRAVDLKPQLVEAYVNRGAAYEQRGDADRAIQDYDRAIELEPNVADAYFTRGRAYGQKGDLNRAVQDFDRALELNPDDTTVRKARELALTVLRG